MLRKLRLVSESNADVKDQHDLIGFWGRNSCCSFHSLSNFILNLEYCQLVHRHLWQVKEIATIYKKAKLQSGCEFSVCSLILFWRVITVWNCTEDSKSWKKNWCLDMWRWNRSDSKSSVTKYIDLFCAAVVQFRKQITSKHSIRNVTSANSILGALLFFHWLCLKCPRQNLKDKMLEIWKKGKYEKLSTG